jgi:hypothetical protein
MTKQQSAIMTLVAAVVVYLVFFRKKKPPAVAGVVSSGSKSVTIDTNVESDTFGETIDSNGVVTGDVAAGSETP